MGVIDLLYKYLPKGFFQKLSKKYYNFLKWIYPKLDEKLFRKIITEKLNIKSGDTVFIHSSIDKLNIDFPVYNVLNILLEVVGDEGTLLFPSWHYSGRAEEYLKKSFNVFNVKKSPSYLGLLTEIARRHKKTERSLHPTNSIVAIGKNAKILLEDHHKDIYPQGIKSPFYKMISHKAKIIGLGEKVVSLSFVHCVEDVMKGNFPYSSLTDKVYDAKVMDYNGNTLLIKTKAAHESIKHRNIPKFFDDNIPSNICERFRYHGVNYFSCDAYKLFEIMKSLAEKNITIYTKKNK